MPSQISGRISIAISFLSGMIFSNAVAALAQGQYVISFLSFAAIIVAIIMKKFVDWELR